MPYTVDQVVQRLNKYEQRATYAALEGACGGNRRNIMSARAVAPLNSWVVGKRTGCPTGYPASAIHPNLKRRGLVIDSGAALRQWLNQNP